MQKEELKKRAQSIVQIPPHFKPVIEDILENDPVQGEGIFTWVNEAREEYIDLTLDLKGNLLHLSIDKKVEDIINNPLNEREKREIAEGFLGYHYPDALKSLTLSKVRNQTYDDIFYFEQMVMDLPLPNAGCTIVIDHWGDVTGFTYEGIKAIPEIPATLISKEKLVADLQTRLDFKLVVMQPEEGGFRLVYEPTTECMDFKAGVLEPTLTIIHEEDVVPKIIPLPILANPPRVQSASIEEIIGIPEDMEIIRETELCDERGVVWRWKNWVGKEQDLTLNSFFANHNDDTVKAFIHKETGKVTRFIWFYKRNGELQLTREECFARAVDFLCRMVPEYCPYLQLVVREDAYEDEDEDEPNTISGFTFWLHNGHGIPIQSEIVMVGVNRTTGQIDHYSGLHMKPEQLQQIPTEPVISKEEARERFMEHLDFKLAWSWYYDNQNESYILAYEACDSLTQTFIEYIDAITGDVITYKNPF